MSHPQDHLGRIIRETWIQWAKEQDRPKEDWLAPYEDTPENIKDVDRRLGAAIVYHVLSVLQPRRVELIEKSVNKTINQKELDELYWLQKHFFQIVEIIAPPPDNTKLEADIAELKEKLGKCKSCNG